MSDIIVENAGFACVFKVEAEVGLDVESGVEIKRQSDGFFDTVGLVGENDLFECAVRKDKSEVLCVFVIRLLVAYCKVGRNGLSHAVLMKRIFVFVNLFEQCDVKAEEARLIIRNGFYVYGVAQYDLV